MNELKLGPSSFWLYLLGSYKIFLKGLTMKERTSQLVSEFDDKLWSVETPVIEIEVLENLQNYHNAGLFKYSQLIVIS